MTAAIADCLRSNTTDTAVLELGVVGQSIFRTFAAGAGLFDSSKRRDFGRDQFRVDPGASRTDADAGLPGVAVPFPDGYRSFDRGIVVGIVWLVATARIRIFTVIVQQSRMEEQVAER